jgi:hypothetical protein
MNLIAFWISFGIGTLISLAVCFRFSRSGSHPRFRPALGVVAIVFVVLLGGVALISALIANAVGNKVPPVRLNESTNSAPIPDKIAP